jgi:Xaa-Pro aminopeptidase
MRKLIDRFPVICPAVFMIILAMPFVASGQAGPAILGLKDRAQTYDRWLRIRLESVLPEIMRREKIDMWLVICAEYEEDPVYLSLVPYVAHSARRTTMLVFFDKGKEGIERLTVGRYGIGDLYRASWDPEKIDQWNRLAQVIKERNPQRIGIDESEIFAFGDGISATHKTKLVQAIGPEYAKRFVSAERLAVGWLERRTPAELEVYDHIVAVAHEIIAEAFTRNVITPGVTTTSDVVWWMREKVAQLKMETWFQPSIEIQRPKTSPLKDSEVIHRGDLLHCDFGIRYLGLCTDTQQHAYLLLPGEEDAPAGLKAALAQGNRLQDILLGEFREGRSGNEILAASLQKAKGEGLQPSIYTHPLGVHGHAAGPTIGLWDMQGGVPGAGDYPVFADTVYSIELNIRAKCPEWGGQDVQIALEQDAVFQKSGPRFLDRRQTVLHLIR